MHIHEEVHAHLIHLVEHKQHLQAGSSTHRRYKAVRGTSIAATAVRRHGTSTRRSVKGEQSKETSAHTGASLPGTQLWAVLPA